MENFPHYIPVHPVAAIDLRAAQISTLRRGSVPTVGSSKIRSSGLCTMEHAKDRSRC